MGNQWTRLALSESQAPEESLALTDAQLHCPVTAQPLSQRLTIPEISCHAIDLRRFPQHHSKMHKLESESRAGLPGLSPSIKPDNPSALKRLIQYSTVRVPSPRNCATCGALMPCATNSTPCS